MNVSLQSACIVIGYGFEDWSQRTEAGCHILQPGAAKISLFYKVEKVMKRRTAA